MSTHETRSGAWAVRRPLYALLISALGVGAGTGPMIQAQQDTWTTEAAQKVGVRLLETRDATGPAAYPVTSGDLLFFTNAGTGYGSKNRKNAVVVINAKTLKPIATSNLDAKWSERWTSYSVGVSPDAKYVYLPALAPASASNSGSLLVLDARTLKIHQVLTSPAQRPNQVKIYEDWTGKKRVLVEDFNWLDPKAKHSAPATGFYVIDPSDNNRVVAGMVPGNTAGITYAGFVAPDGRYLYSSLPGPEFQLAVSRQTQGWVAKIDMQTWNLVDFIRMGAYPLWTAFSQDGKWAWTTNSGDDKVVKVERSTRPGQVDKIVAEVPTGPGPYAVQLNADDKDVWVSNKGEGRAVGGRSITIIDAATNQVKRTLSTDCVANDHLILSPDGQEMWAMCNGSHEIVVLDTKTYGIKARIRMPNQGDPHGGSFVSYTQGPTGLVGETVSDLSGLHGSARDAARKGTPWVPAGPK